MLVEFWPLNVYSRNSQEEMGRFAVWIMDLGLDFSAYIYPVWLSAK